MFNLAKLEEQKKTETKYFDRLSVAITNIALLRANQHVTSSQLEWQTLNTKSLIAAFEAYLNKFGATNEFIEDCVNGYYTFNNCVFHFEIMNDRFYCDKASFLGVDDVV